MELRRVGVLSAGKVLGALYLLVGLIFGIIFGLIALLIGVVGGAALGGADQSGAVGSVGFGIAGFFLYAILFPIFYGIFGIIGAAIYNLVARVVGGIELEIEPRPSPVGSSTLDTGS